MKALILLLGMSLALTRLAAHEHHPPHQGSLQVFGKEFAHLELVLDAKTGRLTAYALDGEAEKPERLTQKAMSFTITQCVPARPAFTLRLKAVANPLTGETLGDSSQFQGQAHALVGVSSFEGSAGPVTIRGVRFKSNRLRHPAGNEDGED